MQQKTTNTIATIRVASRLDFAARDAFRHAADAAVASPEVRRIVVDLRGTAYVDSAALGMLLILRDKATAAGKTVAIASAPGTVRDILRIANFEKLFEFEP
jgi:anti-anti-sigma factor